MMYKNNRSLLILLAFVGLLFGCADLLEEDPKGLVTPEGFFNNEDETNLALNGLQARMNTAAGVPMVRHQFLGTDIGVQGRVNNVVPYSVYDLTVLDATIESIWRDLYAGVRDANLIIAGIEASSLSDAVKQRTLGQAYFFRAYFYYRLTTMWGDVPYWREALDIDVISLLGKTSIRVIQRDMIDDLEIGISSGLMATTRWNENNGRPTEWSARMMKAHLHMWREEYSEARVELQAIINNSPHTTLGAYGDLYREGNDLNDELIYGVEFLSGVVNNAWHNQAHPIDASETEEALASFSELGIFLRASIITHRKSFTDTYDDTDDRKIYNVFDRHVLNDTEVMFNQIYIPKYLRANVPVSDPLFINPDPDGQSSAPMRLMLLADAYLLLAEAEFMLNGSSAIALEAINIVRRRANLLDLNTLTLEDIQSERAKELSADGMGRKNDLIRWGILESTIAALGDAETAAGANQQAIDRAFEQAGFISAGLTNQHRFLPIPFGDIIKSQDLGGALEQNPLWE